ncbi:uncharacterized protein EAF01_008105 [Botrytis porri]|uniref:uncharacterized protein n=1 Tax=Botrytis porri TaxID=87229 RepID=UPI0019019EB3|nr:uncharacterized protein EAF01_008105 [Botrytis porri]KAF7898892.1 hypothetical protein EAF01_008105 [Botrytis porri]
MALIFWHGGNLLADVKLEHVELWIVVLAILSGGEGEVLKEIDLSIRPDQNLAIVGPPGSGKPTIIALLEKLYTINNGSILINLSSLNEIDTGNHRSQTGLVSQDTTLFEGTLRENIFLGVHDLSSIDERLENAAKDANVHDFIISLQKVTIHNVERKVSVSAGGRGNELHLLEHSEKEVLDALNRMLGQITTITVAHRLATIRNADCILVHVKGRIVERGTHLELMELRGTYWAMSQAQALDKDL